MKTEIEYLKDVIKTHEGVIQKARALLFESEETKTPYEIYKKICDLKNELEIYKKAIKIVSNYIDDSYDCSFCEYFEIEPCIDTRKCSDNVNNIMLKLAKEQINEQEEQG